MEHLNEHMPYLLIQRKTFNYTRNSFHYPLMSSIITHPYVLWTTLPFYNRKTDYFSIIGSTLMYIFFSDSIQDFFLANIVLV